jgi:hypothetical protein
LRLLGVAERLLGMDRATPVVDRPGLRQQTFADLVDRFANAGWNLRDMSIFSSRARLFGAIEHLRFEDGDKHLLFIARGAIAVSKDDARILARRANDARVAISYVSVGGTRLAGPSGCVPCRDLVEGTGGYYTSLEVGPEAIAKIEESTRTSYLLGYAPVNSALDGTYRDVQVKVRRPGVVVRFRRGYYAAPEPDPEALREALARTNFSAAERLDVDARDVTVRLAAAPDPARPSAIVVELTIAVARLSLPATSDGRRMGRLDVRIYCGDAAEKVVGSSTATLDINATEATYQQWLAEGFKRSLVVTVTAPARFVKAIVFDSGSGLSGSAVLDLRAAR